MRSRRIMHMRIGAERGAGAFDWEPAQFFLVSALEPGVPFARFYEIASVVKR